MDSMMTTALTILNDDDGAHLTVLQSILRFPQLKRSVQVRCHVWVQRSAKNVRTYFNKWLDDDGYHQTDFQSFPTFYKGQLNKIHSTKKRASRAD